MAAVSMLSPPFLFCRWKNPGLHPIPAGIWLFPISLRPSHQIFPSSNRFGNLPDRHRSHSHGVSHPIHPDRLSAIIQLPDGITWTLSVGVLFFRWCSTLLDPQVRSRVVRGVEQGKSTPLRVLELPGALGLNEHPPFQWGQKKVEDTFHETLPSIF